MPRPNAETAATKPRGGGGLPKLSNSRDLQAQEKRVAASPPFWLVHDPGVYRIIEGRVLPGLRQMKLESGRNGVIQLEEDGPLIVDGAEENLRQKGSTPIPWDVDPDPYIVEQFPGVWTTRWATLTPGSAHVRTDDVGYADWVESLVTRGVLRRPSAADLDRLVSGLRFDIEKSSENPAVQPHRVSVLRAQLAVAERELDAAQEREREELARQAGRAAKREARAEERGTPKTARNNGAVVPPVPDAPPATPEGGGA